MYNYTLINNTLSIYMYGFQKCYIYYSLNNIIINIIYNLPVMSHVIFSVDVSFFSHVVTTGCFSTNYLKNKFQYNKCVHYLLNWIVHEHH